MSRRGYTLLEMLIVMACMVVMFSLMSQVLVRLWATMRDGREQGEVTAVVMRLTRHFRDDLHAAQEVKIESFCKLELVDGSQVTYQKTEQGLLREETHKTAVVQRELYRLPSEMAFGFKQSSSGGTRFVELNLSRPFSPQPSSQQTGDQLRIRAAVGRKGMP